MKKEVPGQSVQYRLWACMDLNHPPYLAKKQKKQMVQIVFVATLLHCTVNLVLWYFGTYTFGVGEEREGVRTYVCQRHLGCRCSW